MSVFFSRESECICSALCGWNLTLGILGGLIAQVFNVAPQIVLVAFMRILVNKSLPQLFYVQFETGASDRLCGF